MHFRRRRDGGDGGDGGAGAAAAGAAAAVRAERLVPLLLQDGLLQRLDPRPRPGRHPALRPAREGRGEHEDHPGAAAARQAPVRDPHGGAGGPAPAPPAALRRRQQPPELPRPAGDDGGAAGPLRAHRQAGAAVHGRRGAGLLAGGHHLHRPQAPAGGQRRPGPGRRHHAAPQRAGVGVPRGDAQPQRELHAALQARGLPPRRAGSGPRGPHRHLLLPAFLQQTGATLHGRAVRDRGAAAAADSGPGPRGRPRARRQGPSRHARRLRGPRGRAQPHGARPAPLSAPRRPRPLPPHGEDPRSPRRSTD